MTYWLDVILLAGVLLSVLPLGHWLVHGVEKPGKASILVALAAGTGFWTLLMVGAGLASLFDLTLFGTFGWMAALAWAVARNRSRLAIRPSIEWPKGRVARSTALLASLLVIGAGVFYVGFPKESILGERDEGIYAQHALHLAKQGSSRIAMHTLDSVQAPVAPGLARDAGMPGLYPDGDQWIFQFSAATPTWMALLAMAFGDLAMFRLNALVGALNCVVFYMLARTLLQQHRAWALAALAVFAFNPVQVWISRTSLGEPLAAWFALCGLLAVAPALVSTRWRPAIVAGTLLGATAFARIDGILTLPALLAAWAAARALGVVEYCSKADRALQRMATACTLACLAAMGYYALFVSQYFLDTTPQLAGAGILILGLSALCRLARSPGIIGFLRDHRRRVVAASMAMVFLAFVYGLHVRPHAGGYSLIDSELVASLNGARDHREDSLLRLAGYLFLPTVYLALVGVLCWMRTLAYGTTRAPQLIVPAMLLLPATIPLWNPMVSPDMIWGLRRWVPFVLAAAAIFAAYGASRIFTFLSRSDSRTGNLVAAGTMAALAVSALLWSQRATLFLHEDRHLLHQVKEIAAFLPEDHASMVVGNPPLAGALLAAYGKPVVALRAIAGTVPISELGLGPNCSSTRPCYVLHPKSLIVTGKEGTLAAYGSIRRQRRDVSTTSVPRGAHPESFDYAITRVAF
jgi:hypothetical protein